MNKSILLVIAVVGLFFIGIAGFVSLLVGGLFYATSGAVTAADSMLAGAANGNTAVVRQYLSVDYSDSLSDGQLEELIDESRLDEFKSVFWSQRSIENNFGSLDGTFTTKTGGQVPLKLSLVFENDQWKIADILASSSTRSMSTGLVEEKSPSIEVAEDSSAPMSSTPISVSKPDSNFDTIPTESAVSPMDRKVVTIADIPDVEQANALVKDWTTRFCQSVSNKDFSEFHAATAPEFQEEFTLARFTETFQEFIDREIDLRWVKDVTPVFDRSPMMDAEGSISLEGVFPANPPVEFEYLFVMRSNQWKPLAVSLNIPGPKLEIPDFEFIKKLVIRKTLKFGRAVDEQDFSSFHRNELAAAFREKFTILQFAEIFKEFVNERASLSWIKGVEPNFDPVPSMNTEGILQVSGTFPSEPKVDFRYAFVNERSRWRMVMININVPNEDEVAEEANAKSGQDSDQIVK